MADPSPVTGESRLELEAKIADVIDATKEEMFEYFAEREEMTAAQRAKREGKYHDEVKEVGSLMAAQMVRYSLHYFSIVVLSSLTPTMFSRHGL
jgi:hypothetical protein